MNRTFDEAAAEWVNKSYGIMPDLGSVHFDVYNGPEGCDTCGADPPVVSVSWRVGKDYKSREIDGNLTDLIAQLVEV